MSMAYEIDIFQTLPIESQLTMQNSSEMRFVSTAAHAQRHFGIILMLHHMVPASIDEREREKFTGSYIFETMRRFF
jgi:hypothetical protein